MDSGLGLVFTESEPCAYYETALSLQVYAACHKVKYYLVTSSGETSISFGQDALHPYEESALDFEFLDDRSVGRNRWVHRQNCRHFLVIGWMYILVDGVSCQFHLGDGNKEIRC